MIQNQAYGERELIGTTQFGRNGSKTFGKPASNQPYNHTDPAKSSSVQNKSQSQKSLPVRRRGHDQQHQSANQRVIHQGNDSPVEDLIDLSGSEEVPMSNNTDITSDMEALRPIRLGEERRANNAEDSMDFENVVEKGLEVDDDNIEEDVESVETKQLEDYKQSNLEQSRQVRISVSRNHLVLTDTSGLIAQE